MSNIDKQAVTAKTKELASLMVERFSMNPVSCKLLNEAWKKEFPDEVAIAERMLALLDELEHYKSREERVTKLVLDNSTSWDALYKKLEAAEQANKLAQEATEKLVQERNALAAENEELKYQNPTLSAMMSCLDAFYADDDVPERAMMAAYNILRKSVGAPATDAFLAEMRAQAHKEGAYFVANRMLAAWDAGFIDDTAKNAADIARMILTSTEFMADAPEGDFDRSFADGVLEGIAAQLRKGVQS